MSKTPSSASPALFVEPEKSEDTITDMTTTIAIGVMCATLVAMLCLIFFLCRTMSREKKKSRDFWEARMGNRASATARLPNDED